MKTNSLDFDAQALREKILDLAMRGKLIKQDPNDESASVLLEKIKAEKAKLVKEGKIKKNKPLPEITDDEKPFDIPDSWEWVRLGDIFSINDRNKATDDMIVGFLPMKNIKDGYENSFTIEEKSWGKVRKGYTHIQVGDIALSKITPCFQNRKSCIITDLPNNIGAATTEIYALYPLIRTFSSLYIYFLKSKMFIEEGTKNFTGNVGQQRVPKKFVENFVIPLPPLSEQSRIAAKIAQLFALLRKVESSTQQYAKLQTLLKSKVLDLAMRGKLVEQDPNDEPASVLLEKIKAEKEQLIKEKKIKKSKPLPPISDEEKTFEIPDSWEWVRLGDVTNFVGTGMVIPANKQFDTFTSQMLPYFKMNNIGNWDGEFGVNNWTYVLKTQNSDNYLLKSGQLLFNTRNSRELVGKTTIVPDNLNKKILANNNILRIESFGKMKLKYINYYLISPFSRHMFLNMTAATTNVAAIYQKQLNKLLVPLPPLEEQKRIVKKIDQLFILLKRDKNYKKVK